ncbi:MAG: hypothetical protein P1P88_02040 [Bacteroidales bacterium]|nr:hypothetical protein [Bacteroidales bacterium]
MLSILLFNNRNNLAIEKKANGIKKNIEGELGQSIFSKKIKKRLAFVSIFEHFIH